MLMLAQSIRCLLVTLYLQFFKLTNVCVIALVYGLLVYAILILIAF